MSNQNKPSITIFGLGRMGAQIARRLYAGGHTVYAWNRADEPDLISDIKEAGIFCSSDMEEVITQSGEDNRIFWIMIPNSAVEEFLFGENNLKPYLRKGDIVIDGGNTRFEDSMRRETLLEAMGVHFFDSGTSGGIWGERNGFALMVGGSKEKWPIVEPFYKTLSAGDNYGYLGKAGAGHYTKMVHNAIEYGMMQSIAEGYALLHASPFNLDLKDVSRIYQKGTVIRSWLIDLMKDIYDNEDIESTSGIIESNGEALWALETGKKLGIEMPAIEAALKVRFESSDPKNKDSYSNKIVALLRKQFGGHAIHKK